MSQNLYYPLTQHTGQSIAGKIRGKVASSNARHEKLVTWTFWDILAGRTTELARDVIGYYVSDGVDEYGYYDVEYGTKSHTDESYLMWLYDGSENVEFAP